MVQVRGPRRGLRLAGTPGVILVALAALASGGCSLHQAGVTPPDNRIFFPSGGVVDPDGAFLYVANSNSDLRYNAGTIVAVDLSLAASDRQNLDWPMCPSDPRYVPAADAPHACCRDFLDPTVLNCDDQALIDREWTVRVGSFAGTPAIQRFLGANPAFDPDHPDTSGPKLTEPASSNRRMFVPVRGDTSITMMNLARTKPSPEDPTKRVLPDGPLLYCTGRRTNPNPLPLDATDGADVVPLPAQARFPKCGDEWRITRKNDPLETSTFKDIPDSDVIRLPDEPYTLAVDDAANLLYVGHLRGEVSLVDLGLDSEKLQIPNLQVPNLLDHTPNVLPGDANGSIGVTSLTIRDAANGSCHKEVFASSRYRPVASSFVIYGLHGARCDATSTDVVGSEADEGLVIIPTGTTYSTGLGGSDTRGIQFVGQDRVFLMQRNPPALVGIDTTTFTSISTMEICQGPTNMVQPTKTDGKTPLFGVPLLFITCFDSGEVYVVDPAVPQIRSVIQVGRQPISTVFDSTDPLHAYVIGFGANNVSVIDLDPASPTRDRVIQRVGFPNAVPRDVGPQ
jgi:hypothetical protein